MCFYEKIDGDHLKNRYIDTQDDDVIDSCPQNKSQKGKEIK